MSNLQHPLNANVVVTALGALAQDTRLQVFRLLVERGPDGLAAGVIAERLGIPPSSLTFHLQQLLHANLVTQRRLSRQLIYAANHVTMNGLVAYLTENCCGEGAGIAICNPSASSKPSPKSAAAQDGR